MEPVQLESLVGEHVLSGVDFETPEEWRGDRRVSNVIRFVLDGRIYMASEDDNDGYRSSMESLEVVDDGPPVANTFPPVRVVVRHVVGRRSEHDYAYGNDLLEFIDIANGEIILEVGTENVHDYYPGFVNHFHPDRLSVNAGKGGE